jgi:hypothetical protein
MWLPPAQQAHTFVSIPPPAYFIGHAPGFVKKFRDKDVRIRRKTIQAELFELFINLPAGLLLHPSSGFPDNLDGIKDGQKQAKPEETT